MKIQVFYGPSGIRGVVWGDIIALLLHRGHKALADELTLRANQSFEQLDKKVAETWIASTTWPKRPLEEIIEEPKNNWVYVIIFGLGLMIGGIISLLSK